MNPQIVEHGTLETVGLLLSGAFGAIAKDCFVDGEIVLPHVVGDRLVVGFLGGALVGAFVGYVVDGSFVSAALAGFTGASVITSLVSKSLNGSTRPDGTEPKS
jgi:hypothetical protein